MHIKEIKGVKVRTEEEIRKSINYFIDTTGLIVSEVIVKIIPKPDKFGGKKNIIHVHVEAKLDL